MIPVRWNTVPKYQRLRDSDIPAKTKLRLLEKERDAIVAMGRRVPLHVYDLIEKYRKAVA